MYVSAIAVPDSDDSSVAQALVASWRSWDPGAAVQDRIENTRTTLQATADDIAAVDHFRQKVFQKVNDNWGEIFRNGADANLNLRPCRPAGPTC